MVKRSKAVRRYDGCRHCHSLTLKSLPTTFGDPEGIRNDYQCLVCGGVFGCCKSSFTTIHEDEWEGEWPMPRPDKSKVDAMEILIALEENHGFKFRSREQGAADTVAEIIRGQRKAMMKSAENMKGRLEAIRKVA